MHFVFLTFEFPPFFGGGLSTYMLHACRALKQSGHRVTVILPDENLSQRYECKAQDGINVLRFNYRHHDVANQLPRWPAISYAASDALLWVDENLGEPDLIESCDGNALAYFCLMRKAALEAPFCRFSIVVTAHTPISLINKWNERNVFLLSRHLHSNMERWCLEAADEIHSPSNFILRELQSQLHLTNTRHEIIRNPFEPIDRPSKSAIDSPTRYSSNSEEEIEAIGLRPPYVCVISRVVEWKGIPDIVEQMARLWKRGDQTQLCIVGRDTNARLTSRSLTEMLKSNFSQFIADGRLFFTGELPPEIVSQIRSKSIAQIHPSRFENFPYTVLEALSSHTIVIASENGGQSEIIEHGKSGFLYDPGSESQLASILEQVKSDDFFGAYIRENGALRVKGLCNYENYTKTKVACIDRLKVKARATAFPGAAMLSQESAAVERSTSTVGSQTKIDWIIRATDDPEQLALTLTSSNILDIVSTCVVVSDSLGPAAELEERICSSKPKVRRIHCAKGGFQHGVYDQVARSKEEFVLTCSSGTTIEIDFIQRALPVFYSYACVGYVYAWEQIEGSNHTRITWPSFENFQYAMNTGPADTILFRTAGTREWNREDEKFEGEFFLWDLQLSLWERGYCGVSLSRPWVRAQPDRLRQLPHIAWSQSYQRLIAKHREGFSKNQIDVANLMSTNGSNYDFHEKLHVALEKLAAPQSDRSKYNFFSIALNILRDTVRDMKK